MQLNRDTTLFIALEEIPSSVQYALNAFKRDWQDIFSTELTRAGQTESNQIQITMHKLEHDESFRIYSDADSLYIEGHDDLGVVFGMYYVCEHILGIDPYRFWTDFQVTQADEINVSDLDYQSPEPAVRFRGWFMNDEDCLIGWHDEMEISMATWEIIYESALRAGYNMVIPGTTAAPDDPQMQLATDMGLWLTQHHAQPLGAKLFRVVHPGIEPRIPEDIPLFKEIYLEAINKLKDKKVVWSLGFRGQGDLPFFIRDTRYATPEQRGKAIGDMIRLQRQLVEDNTTTPQYFVHHVYSESAELYKEGHLSLDDDIIRVWADNGYGAMRARREWTPDAEVLTYPIPKDADKRSGVYYHVQFHDLQTAHRITPFVAPQLIVSEYQKLYDAGNIAYVLVNVGNIRPHVFNLELLNHIMQDCVDSTSSIFAKHETTWAGRYFPDAEQKILDLHYRYHQAFFKYAHHTDDVGGEELCHWGTRYAIQTVVRKQDPFEMHFMFPFLKGQVTTNREIFAWLIERLEAIMPEWEAIEQTSHEIEASLPDIQKTYYTALIKRHILFMRYSYAGFLETLYGCVAFMDEDYQSAFIHFSDGKVYMISAWDGITADTDEKWANFYRGEWLTGVRESIRWLQTMQGLCRIQGDTDAWWSGWMREAQGHEKEVMLATIKQSQTDFDRLAQALKLRREGKVMPLNDLLG